MTNLCETLTVIVTLLVVLSLAQTATERTPQFWEDVLRYELCGGHDIARPDLVYALMPLGLVKPSLAIYGADPDVVDSQGFTALHYVAGAGNWTVVE